MRSAFMAVSGHALYYEGTRDGPAAEGSGGNHQGGKFHLSFSKKILFSTLINVRVAFRSVVGIFVNFLENASDWYWYGSVKLLRDCVYNSRQLTQLLQL